MDLNTRIKQEPDDPDTRVTTPPPMRDTRVQASAPRIKQEPQAGMQAPSNRLLLRVLTDCR